MKIQDVQWNDPEVAQLRNEQAADLGARYGFEPTLDEPEPAGLVSMLKLTTDEGEPVGCIALVDQTGVEDVFGPGLTVEMRKVFLRPAFRGNGYSYLLLDEVETIARNRGFQQIVLVSGVEQPEAVAGYRKRGYQEMEAYGFNAQFETSLFFKLPLA